MIIDKIRYVYMLLTMFQYFNIILQVPKEKQHYRRVISSFWCKSRSFFHLGVGSQYTILNDIRHF